MDKNTVKTTNDNGNAAVAEQPEVRTEGTEEREARMAADRLLALLKPIESKIPRADFLFVADCHDPERRISPSRLAKLRILARTYANGTGGEWLTRNPASSSIG